NYSIALYNLNQIIVPLLIIIYILDLTHSKKHFIHDFLMDKIVFINMYFIINLPFIFLQLSGEYWLTGIKKNDNTLTVDLISGLYGNNGIPMMTLFTCFTIFLNYHYCNCHSYKNEKVVLSIFNVFILVFFSILSLFNDNKGFYLIFIIYLLVVLFVNYANNNQNISFKSFKFSLKIIGSLLLSCPFIYLIYRYTPLYNVINQIVHEFLLGIYYAGSAHGSSERIGMITYALSNDSNRLMGYGIGNARWTDPGTFGFEHFGQSDFGVFLCLGGIFLIASIFIIITSLLYRLFFSYYAVIPLILLFIVLSIYTQIFTVTSLTISVSFLCVLCSFSCKKTIKLDKGLL
ncbi:hypothetical protein, partial [Bifidobacterium felsineum]|uniref:hypothetical protein n=1 Tax=Bifidobacterium felsineum TaxID=2045440 RepID=UPI001BDDAEC9